MAPHALAAGEYGQGPPPTHTMVESIPQALLPVETMALAQVAASAVVAQVVAQVAASNWTSELLYVWVPVHPLPGRVMLADHPSACVDAPETPFLLPTLGGLFVPQTEKLRFLPIR